MSPISIGRPLPMANASTPSPQELLDIALGWALPEGRVARPVFAKTRERHINRRGIFWVGQTCNLRCYFCYYLDRIEDPAHPEHPFMSLEKAKQICKTLVDVYGNTSIDIQGGEPTLWKDIYALVRYCADIGLSPTVITNAQVLDDKSKVELFKEAGLRDFLVSVQGLGPVYDELVGRPGAHKRQMIALRNIQEVGIPFRINCVMSKPAVAQLPQVAELGVKTGAQVVNFIAFNPFDDQRNEGKRSARNVSSYTEISDSLNRALDVLEAGGVEGNARYIPLCIVAERHRRRAHSFRQIPWDLHENDFASWSWTGQQPQRMRDGALTAPPVLGSRLRLGPLKHPVRWLSRHAGLGPPLRALKRSLDGVIAHVSQLSGRSHVDRLIEDAKLRADEHCNYQKGPACAGCDARDICDGFHGDYAQFFGVDEARPLHVGRVLTDPAHWMRQQDKVIHPLDEAWVARSGRAPAAR